MKVFQLILVAGASALASSAIAQTNIDATDKNSWSENAGWMNWRDANGGAQGARDNQTYLSGFIWTENIGWINLGGTPVSSVQYTNTTGADCGVNVSSTGGLSGLGWSENIGWINFAGGAMATPAQPARLDIAAGRLRGYAWSENIGWINLDAATAGQFVKRTCYANCDGSTGLPLATANDFQCFLNAYVSHQAYANCDRSSSAPTLTANDFQCFLDNYVSGCP